VNQQDLKERTPEMPKSFGRLPGKATGIAFAAGLIALQAQAQSQPWYVGVQQRFEHQTNIYQLSTGAVSDTISATSLIAGINQPIGRQRLFGSVALSTNRFQDQKHLNHDGHALNLGLDWETAGNLSGSIGIDASQTLAQFTPVGLPGTTAALAATDNTTRTQGARGVVRLGGVTRMSFEAGGATRRTRYDNDLYRQRNLNIDEGWLGMRYRPEGSLVLGLALRATRGDYPNMRFNPFTQTNTSEGFERDNVDITADWPLSGASRVDARLSFGRDRYDTLTARNFSGATGALTWRWQPTGRTSVTTAFTRTSGDETNLNIVPGQVPYSTSANRVANALGSVVEYDLTGKIKVRGGLAFSEASAVSLQPPFATTSEFLTTATLGGVWEATRAIRVGCDLTQRSRATKAGVAGYDSSVIGCFGEFVLR
jgi:hypothetical protein